MSGMVDFCTLPKRVSFLTKAPFVTRPGAEIYQEYSETKIKKINKKSFLIKKCSININIFYEQIVIATCLHL